MRMHSRLKSVSVLFALTNASRKAALEERDWDGWEFIGEDWVLVLDVLVDWECWLALWGVTMFVTMVGVFVLAERVGGGLIGIVIWSWS